jgi:hypothetical protein
MPVCSRLNMERWDYFASLFSLAQRALTAAAIRARPSGDIVCFFFLSVATGAAVDLGLPGPLLAVSANAARASCSREISESMRAIIVWLMRNSVAHDMPLTANSS